MKRTLLTLLYTTLSIVAVVWLVRFFAWEPYRITPGQMDNTLLHGDQLWVNKWDFKWGKKEPKRRDILVYTLPEVAQPESYRERIAIARCVGLPGDTLRSVGNRLYINGKEVAQPPLMLEAYLSPDSMHTTVNRILQENDARFTKQGNIQENRLLFLSRYDYDKVRKQLATNSLLYPVFLHRDNYEIILPRKQETIRITPQNATLLHRLLTQYEHRNITLQDSILYENGIKLNACRLQQNYYWVLGDNRAGLSDSRTFGPLPYSRLIGRGVCIGLSQDPDKPFRESFRTDRFFKTQL